MEFKLLNPEDLGKPILWNAGDIKQYVADVAKDFEMLVYEDEQEAEARKDRSNLNKLRTALKTAKKNVKEQRDIPYEVFAKEMDEAIKILDETIQHIDEQTSSMDAKRRSDNLEKAKTLYDLTVVAAGLDTWLPWAELLEMKASEGTTYGKVFGNKGTWGKSDDLATSGKKVIDILETLVSNVESAINSVKAMNSQFEREALEVLKMTRSTEKAFAEMARLQKIEDDKQRAIEEAKRQAELEAQRRLELERRRAEEAQRRAVEEAERKAKEEAEAKARAEREALEAQQRAEHERLMEEVEEANKKAEAAKKVSFVDATVEIEEPRQEADSMVRQESQEGQWISFKAYMTIDQALELKRFFNDRGIKFGRV